MSFFHRVARAPPRFRAAEQGRDVFKTLLFEFERRTGAQVFGRSRTVEYDHLIAREFARARSDLPLLYIDRPFDVILLVLHLPAYVHHDGRAFFDRLELSGGRAVATVRQVADADRPAELSRMLSGQPEEESALAHARSLLREVATRRDAWRPVVAAASAPPGAQRRRTARGR